MSSVEELQARIADLEERLARHEERTEPMSAEVMYNTAQEFITNNPDVWRSMVNVARSRARQGKRVSMKRIVEDTRDQYGAVWQTEDFKLSNSVTAALARFLVLECPEAKDHMNLKRSKVDRYFR
jgi:uncharacterized coiled-coil protein SlyX